MMMGIGMRGLGSAPGIVGTTVNACKENFWSMACWFPGTDAPATMTVTPMPTAICAGTLNADGSCTTSASVNDPNATVDQLATGGQDFSGQVQSWVQATQNSAQAPSATGNYTWLIIGAVAVLGIGLIGGTAAGRHLR